MHHTCCVGQGMPLTVPTQGFLLIRSYSCPQSSIRSTHTVPWSGCCGRRREVQKTRKVTPCLRPHPRATAGAHEDPVFVLPREARRFHET